MRRLAALATAAVLAGLVASAPDSGAQGGARADGRASVVDGVGGVERIAVRASGTRERSDAGTVATPGVRIGSGEATVRTSTDGQSPTVSASAVARSVTLLGGRVTAFGVRRTARIRDGELTRGGRIDGLRIDGKLYDDFDGPRRFSLPGSGVIQANRGASGLRIVLLTDTGGLPAGTDLRIATVRASAEAAAVPTPTPTPSPSATATPQPTATPTRTPTATAPPEAARRRAPSVTSRLTRSGFAFPVYPTAQVADNYGAPRPAPIASHEGVDIFAPFGSPVVAVADGTISKVGTLPISGNRLWLTTDNGDAFFYAHLSAFSDEAVDGRTVKAGTVLGFTGNTGDAEPTPPHVHFEVHPGGIEAPSVDPYPIVMAWKGRQDVAPGAFLRRQGADTTTRPGSLVAVRDFIAE